MKNIRFYNIYIFISTIIRNMVDVYSVIYLYQKNISIRDIVAIYALSYFLGAYISMGSIRLGEVIGYKYILIISSIISCITFYIMDNVCNIYLIAISLSLSMFTYYPIKHYYGIKLLKEKVLVGKMLILTYIATFLASYIAIEKIDFIYLIIISFIGIIPVIFIKDDNRKEISYQNKIDIGKVRFFIFDQFRIVFILLEPIYLYLISNKISYVGIFNIILTISSILCVYILTNKIDVFKNYKYINILFTIVLILKLNIKSKTWLLILAFFEGIGIKSNELVSTINLYDSNGNDIEYLIISEKIICLVRAIILVIIYLLIYDIKNCLYFLLGGIFLHSFQYKKKEE